MLTDLEIAQAAKMEPITEIAKDLGIQEDELDLYGNTKAKIHLSVLRRLKDAPNGRYIDVTAITTAANLKSWPENPWTRNS